jgi:hypothetical protein
MTTTHAFRQALHVPWADPDLNEIVAAVVPGAEYETDWLNAAGTPEAPVDGKQYGRQSADWTEVTWAALSGKPTVFPPSPHSHPWGEITEKPTTFPPSAHGHLQSEISGLVSALDAKAPLASPIFTGAPKAPSPVLTSSADTSIATTLWVQQVLDSYYQTGEVDPLLAAKVSKAGDTMTGPLALPKGTVAAPSLVVGEPGCGFYQAGSGTGSFLNAALNGVLRMRIADGATISDQQFRMTGGSSSTPGFSFSAEPNSGFYWAAAGNIRQVVQGALTLQFTPTLMTAFVPIVLPADPATAMQAATKQYVDAASGGSISDVPLDGVQYTRKDRAWAALSVDAGTY